MRAEEGRRSVKTQKSCGRDVGNGGDLGGKRKTCKQESVGSVATDPDHLNNSKEAGRKAQATQGLRHNCTSRDNVFPLSRLTRGFLLSIIDPLFGRPMRMA